MSGQNGGLMNISVSFVLARLQFRHQSSYNMMVSISEANGSRTSAIWISDVLFNVFSGHKRPHAIFTYASYTNGIVMRIVSLCSVGRGVPIDIHAINGDLLP